MSTRSSPGVPGGGGLSPEPAHPDLMLRELAAHVSGRRGTDPGTQAGIIQKLYDATVHGNDRINNNLQALKDEFNRAGSNTTVRGLLSAGENTALFGGGPVTSGEQALERLRSARMSSARMRQVQMSDVEGLRQNDVTAREDFNWQFRQYVQGEVKGGRTPGGGGTTPEIDAAKADLKATADKLPRERGAMDNLTNILQKMYEQGGIGKLGTSLGGSGDMASIFRGAFGSIVKDLVAAQPELGPAVSVGKVALAAFNAADQLRTSNVQQERSLELSAPLPNQLTWGAGWGWGSPQDTASMAVNLRNATRSMGYASSDSEGEKLGVTLGAQLGRMGVGQGAGGTHQTMHEIVQATVAAMAASTATGMPLPQTTRLMGEFMTQGHMSVEQALDQFRDLVSAADAAGVSVAKLSDSVTSLMQAGASTHMSMASLATLQSAVGPGVDAAKMMAPALTAYGVQGIQYASMLGFKSYDQYVQAQSDPTKMFMAATKAIRRDHFRGNFAGGAAEEVMGQYGIDLSGMPADQREWLVGQVLKPDGLGADYLAQDYQRINTATAQQRKSQSIQSYERQQGTFQFQTLGFWNQAGTQVAGVWDQIVNGVLGQYGGSGGGGGALTPAQRAAYLRAHPGAAPESLPPVGTKPGAHQAVATAPTAAQEQTALFATIVATAIAQMLRTQVTGGPGSSAEAALGAAGHAHVAAARATPHAPGQGQDRQALDVTLQGTLNVTDAQGRQIGTVAIAPQHKRIDPHRVPKGHVPSVVGPQATHPRRDAQPV